MKIKLFLVLIVLFGLFLLWTPPQLFACVLDDSTPPRCVSQPHLLSSQVLVSTVLVTRTTPVVVPSGASPAEAGTVPDDWQPLEPRASLWYRTDYSDNFRELEYWLETNRPDVATFAVYAPQQSDSLSAATKPVGRGTHNKNDPDNVIRWKAGYAWPGIWYVFLTNNTDQPISYKLNHTQETIPVKTCVSYWEPMQGTMVLWTDCGRYTGLH